MPSPPKALSPKDLQSHLWVGADILRSSVDASDYKIYLFGLLFLKYLSDRFDEHRDVSRALSSPPASPALPDAPAASPIEPAPFTVPASARWSNLCSAAHPAAALNAACMALEADNPRLLGIFSGLDFTDRRLGDPQARDALLTRLLQHFDRLDLGHASLTEPDMLGNAYEYLVERFADDAGKKAGEFRTPAQVVDLAVALCPPDEGMRICDPTCGSGGMLLGSTRHLVARGGDPRTLRLHGPESNHATWSICTMNLLLHGRPDARIERGDTLRDPRLLDDQGHLLRFDRVFANPPYSLAAWGHDVVARDPHARFHRGIPPRTRADYAFLQHIVATLDTGGQAAIVIPLGVLFRSGIEATIRQQLLAEDLIQAVIGLPPNLFFGTGIPAAVLVLDRAKPPARQGKVLFLDASRDFEEGSSRNRLRPEDVARIAATFHAFANVPGYARVATLADIAAHEHHLTITRYVATPQTTPSEPPTVAAALTRLRALEANRSAADAHLGAVLRDLGSEEGDDREGDEET